MEYCIYTYVHVSCVHKNVSCVCFALEIILEAGFGSVLSTLNCLDFTVKFTLSTATYAVNFFSKISHKNVSRELCCSRLHFQGAKGDNVLDLSPSALLP